MQARPTVRDLLVGRLVVALTLTLLATSALAGFGLLNELTAARTIVVAAHPSAVIVSQMAGEPADAADAAEAHDHDDGADGDPNADPSGVHSTASASDADGDEHTAPASAAEPAGAGDPPAVVSPSPTTPVAKRREAAGPRGAPRASADVPIVMYHHVGPLPPNPDVFRRDLTVSPELFERTLDRLAEQGVQTVTLADLYEHLAGGPELPKRAAILTFDDGYDDNYDHAFRLLRVRGMVGTFFITTDFVGRPGYLTWEQVIEMANAGMEIAAHSASHPDFTKIGPNELRRQLVEPKAILEAHIGQPVRFLAYPAGKYNATVLAATRAAGYEAAVTVLHGTRHTAASAFELRRVRARGADTLAEIIARMTPPTWRQ